MRLICHAVLAAATVSLLSATPENRAEDPLTLSSVAVPSTTLQASVHAPIAGKPDKRRKRPSWIWRVFGAALPAVGCGEGPPAGGVQPTVVLDRLDDPLVFCFEGFTLNDEPVMRITAPDGTATTWPGRKHHDGVRSWVWYSGEEVLRALPHPGTYRFEVTATETPATSGLIVAKPASRPGVHFSLTDRVEPGETVSAAVVGRRPGSPIFASLYGRETPERLRVVHDFPPVIADRWGEGVIRWTVSDEPDGDYGFLVETPQNTRPDACRRFNACRPFRVRR
ncbi:hypothetical protein [Actinoplanes sp. OR16]|uniref:hypothetical protein n=1 Tax=Actinoplanes sp. OR16 TaxID=946334 RepID=UPI000FD92444|nr:hypothetical protein [Actinoplanes sp. OR16]